MSPDPQAACLQELSPVQLRQASQLGSAPQPDLPADKARQEGSITEQASRDSGTQDSELPAAGAGLAAAIGMVSRHITPERSQLAWSDDVVATACRPTEPIKSQACWPV